jgi:hypothetical protein
MAKDASCCTFGAFFAGSYCQSSAYKLTIRFGFGTVRLSRTRQNAKRVADESLADTFRISVSYTNKLPARAVPPFSAHRKVKTWHGTPIALQRDRLFRSFAAIVGQCP